MKKLILVIPMLMVFQLATFSQEGISDLERYLDRLNRDKDFFGNPLLKYENIQGTPYLHEEFMEGLLYMKSGVIFKGEYRYDIYADQIEFKKDENVFALEIPDSIIKLQTELYTLAYLEYLDKTSVNKSFMKLLEEGNYTLSHQKRKIFRKAEPIKPYQDTPTPARFDNGGDEYFLRVGDSPAEKISNAKDLIRICGADGGKAKKYIDSEKLNIKKEDDLVKLVKFLNDR